MFTFSWPYFILLLPLPIFVRYIWPPTQATVSYAPRIHFPHLRRLNTAFGKSTSNTTSKRPLLQWLLFLAWVFLLLALMRPQIVNELRQTKNEGHDLMLAVDLSASMQSLDFSEANRRVSRLDLAKKVVKDFVKKREGDRVGLILFGEHAYLQTPLTLDTKAVSEMLDNSLPGMAGDSTAIGDAIGLAVKNLREKPAHSQAIILLTDGEDNSSTIPPLQAAELAKQYGIHIYTVVIGKEGIVPIPDKYGDIAMIENHVDTTLTKKIAEITDGEFYRATDQNALARIYDRIDALEKSESEAQNILIRKPLYQYPIGVALVLLGLLAVSSQIRKFSYDNQSI